jgi:PPOX class probable F420-dependent enzyme
VAGGAALARERFAGSAVARRAPADPDGQPHLVPVVFAVDGDTVWTAVDHKPKSTTSLRRLANIRANPRVSLLVDHYDEDWSQLWWVRADGTAAVVPQGDAAERDGIARLVAKYPQYQADPPPGPVIAVTVGVWRSWTAG